MLLEEKYAAINDSAASVNETAVNYADQLYDPYAAETTTIAVNFVGDYNVRI